MKGRDRAALRGEAHHLTALVHVGKEGITPTLVGALDDVLRTRELVKVQLIKSAELSPKDAARELAAATGAEVVQVIGRTTTLYRENPDLPHDLGAAPPWRDR